MEVFSRNHAAPFSKMLTFYRRDAFELIARYAQPESVPYPEAIIGEFRKLKKKNKFEGKNVGEFRKLLNVVDIS